MKKNKIFIRPLDFIFRSRSFSYSESEEVLKKYKKRYVCILEQELYIKKYEINSNKIIDERMIESWIKNDFVVNDDYLFHYTINKKYLSLYAVKGGINVSRICENSKNVKVIPIQLLIFKEIKRKIKENKWGIVFKFKDIYYYFNVIDNDINETIISDKIEKIKNKISFREEFVNYVEYRLEKELPKEKIIKIGGILNEERTAI